MNQYIDILSIVLILVFFVISIKNLEKGILLGILIKPVVDTSWDVNLMGLSLIEVFSVPFLVLSFILMSRSKRITKTSKILVILWVIAHFGIVFQLMSEPIDGIKSLSKMLYFPVALFLLPYFLLIAPSNSQKQLIRVLIIGALFSSLISIFQFVGVIPYEYDHLSKGLQRANGFYHDMVTSRVYVLQGLLTLAYITLSPRFHLKRSISWLLLFIFLVASYSLFSKALIGILVVAFVLMIVQIRPSIKHYFVGLIIALLFLFSNVDTVMDTTTTLFTDELEYNEGELNDSDRLFAGRGGLWDGFLDKFNNSSSLEQLIGFGINSGRTHNEFLRVLILSGIMGLVAYVLLMVYFLKIALKLFFKKQLSFVLCFAFVIMLMDSIAVVWGLYPFYLVVIVGFFMTSMLEMQNKKKPIKPTISVF